VCTFITIWLGQMVSSIGSRMTVFAITIWAWELTHSATTGFGEFSFPAPSVAIALYSSNCRSLKSQAFDYARRHGCRIVQLPSCCYILAAMCNSAYLLSCRYQRSFSQLKFWHTGCQSRCSYLNDTMLVLSAWVPFSVKAPSRRTSASRSALSFIGFTGFTDDDLISGCDQHRTIHYISKTSCLRRMPKP